MKQVVLGMVALLLAGCAGSGAIPPTQALVPSTSTPPPQALPATATQSAAPPRPADIAAPSPAVIPARAQVIVGLAIEDMAASLDVPPEGIDVRTVEEVVWPDTMLGCEQGAEEDAAPNGEDIAGFRIVLAYGEQTVEYHTDEAGSLRNCVSGATLTVREPVILDTMLSSLIEMARQDLATRLDLPVRRVFLETALPVEWADNGLGCRLRDQEFEPTAVPGYQIIFRVGRETYFYHSNYRQAFYCPAEAVEAPEAAPEIVTGTPPAIQ